MDSNKFRVLIYHCFLMGKNTVTAKTWLDKCYPGSAPSKATVERWFSEFKHGRTNTDDAERSGRPNGAVTPDAELFKSAENISRKRPKLPNSMKYKTKKAKLDNTKNSKGRDKKKMTRKK